MSDDDELRGPLQAVLFDLDGVLVDTAALHLEAYRRAFHHHGLTFPLHLHALVRAGQARSVVMAAAALPPDLRQEISDGKGEAMLELLREGGVAPITGALEFVRDVRARGLRTAVASNSSLAADVLRAAGALPLFDTVVSVEPGVARPKPAPDLYEIAARRLGVQIERCLVIEDNESGALAGRTAGARVVCIGAAPERPAAHAYVAGWGALSHWLRSLR